MGKDKTEAKDAEIFDFKAVGKSFWFKLTEFLDDDVHLMDVKVEGEEKPRPIYLQAKLYDKEGNPVLVVTTVDMEAMPIAAMHNLRNLLMANQMAPVLMVPPMVKLMRLKRITNQEAKRAKDRLKKLGAVDG